MRHLEEAWVSAKSRIMTKGLLLAGPRIVSVFSSSIDQGFRSIRHVQFLARSPRLSPPLLKFPCRSQLEMTNTQGGWWRSCWGRWRGVYFVRIDMLVSFSFCGQAVLYFGGHRIVDDVDVYTFILHSTNLTPPNIRSKRWYPDFLLLRVRGETR